MAQILRSGSGLLAGLIIYLIAGPSVIWWWATGVQIKHEYQDHRLIAFGHKVWAWTELVLIIGGFFLWWSVASLLNWLMSHDYSPKHADEDVRIMEDSFMGVVNFVRRVGNTICIAGLFFLLILIMGWEMVSGHDEELVGYDG